jgi:phage terminase large subunit GpA-like protein
MPIKSVDDLLRQSIQPLKPKEKLSRSDWAERHFQVTKGSSTGRWKTRPYQREILDAWDDPRIWRTSIMKSSRVGATTLLNIDECFSIHWERCDTCTVQPTTGDAEKYSRDTFDDLIENVDVLRQLFSKCKHRDGTNSILEKYINGASLKFIGANSPNGFRRVTYRIVRADETSAYKAGGAGKEGDQIELLLNRTIDYHDRLFIDCSTPTIEGFDRIEDAFKLGDQRHRYLPCPHCGWYQTLSAAAFTPGADKSKPGGFWWEPGKPTSVVYICERCDKPIQHSQKFEMDLHGEWRPSAPPNIDPNGREHRSYHIWAGISYQANASWANIVAEHEKNQNQPEKVQVFINTWLGLPYREDASTRLAAEGLMSRRGNYASGEVPDGVLMICIGVDMQDDRAEVFVWGFGPGNSPDQATAEPERWLIKHDVISCRYDTAEVYKQLDTYLFDSYSLSNGYGLKPAVMAVDSGDGEHSSYVYEYANNRANQGVIATKGMDQIGKPAINNGKRTQYDYKGRPSKTSALVFQVGTDLVKTILMAQLKHGLTSGAGAIHFPRDTSKEFFEQLVSERRHHKIENGQPKATWVRKPGIKAEALDGTVYAYAAFHHAKKKYNPKTMWAQLAEDAASGGKSKPEASPVAFNLLEGQQVY